MPFSVVGMPNATAGDEWGVELVDDDTSQIDYQGSAFLKKIAGNQRIPGTKV